MTPRLRWAEFLTAPLEVDTKIEIEVVSPLRLLQIDDRDHVLAVEMPGRATFAIAQWLENARDRRLKRFLQVTHSVAMTLCRHQGRAALLSDRLPRGRIEWPLGTRERKSVLEVIAPPQHAM